MAIIKLDDKYQICIDSNKDHAARIDLHKTYIDSKTREVRQRYKIIGHYTSMISACNGILRHMNIEKANESDSVMITDYIDIMKENQEHMQNLLKNTFIKELSE